MPIKTALVEDQPKVRESWSRLINSFPDFSCVRACNDGEEALHALPKERPDVILMDIFLPRMSGIECTVRLKALMPQTKIVILTAMNDQELVYMALAAGADGYLLKRTRPSELRTALLDVHGGGVLMNSQMARRVLEASSGKPGLQDEALCLSILEEQILLLIAEGHPHKVVAEKLVLSAETLCGHLKRVLNNLHVSSRPEAVVRYLNSKMQRYKPEDLLG